MRGILVGQCGWIGAGLSGYDGDMFDEILGIAEGTLRLEAFLVIATGASAGREDFFSQA